MISCMIRETVEDLLFKNNGHSNLQFIITCLGTKFGIVKMFARVSNPKLGITGMRFLKMIKK